jgi:hypothetical protein
MAQREKRVWRGICVLEEIRIVPLADGRREAVFVLRDDVASVGKRGGRGVAGGKGKGGEDDD